MRRAALPAKPAQIYYYGGLKPVGTLGEDDFRNHDASASWDDEEADQLTVQLEEALAGLIDSVKRHGANQARDAVVEYASGAIIDIAIIDGRAAIVVDMSNNEAQLRPYWFLDEVLASAAQQAIESDDRDLIGGLFETCQRAALMLEAVPGPETGPEPEPVRRPAGRVGGRVVGKPASTVVPQVRRSVRG